MLDSLKTKEELFTIEQKWAIASVLAALIFAGFAPILIRLSENCISPNTATFNRLWIASVILSLWNGVLTLKSPDSQNQLVKQSNYNYQILTMLIVMGVFSTGYQLLWAWSLSYTSLANSSLLLSLTPLLTALGGWKFLGHSFDRKFLLGMMVALGGIIILEVGDISTSISKLQGDGLALLSAVFSAACMLTMEKLRTHLLPDVIVTWRCAVGAIFLMPIILMNQDNFFPNSWEIWQVLIFLSLTTIISQGLIVYSLKWLSAGFVSTVFMLAPIVVAFMSWTVFNETLGLGNFLAFVIVLSGIYLATLGQGGFTKIFK